MKLHCNINIPAFLWDYDLNEREVIFLAYLLNVKLAHLRGENNFDPREYSYTEIVENRTTLSIHISMFYRFRRELIRKRLLIPFTDRGGDKVFKFNEELWRKFRQMEFSFPLDLDIQD